MALVCFLVSSCYQDVEITPQETKTQRSHRVVASRYTYIL